MPQGAEESFLLPKSHGSSFSSPETYFSGGGGGSSSSKSFKLRSSSMSLEEGTAGRQDEKEMESKYDRFDNYKLSTSRDIAG